MKFLRNQQLSIDDAGICWKENCSQRRCQNCALVCNHTDKIQLFNMLLPLSLLNSRIQRMRTWSTFIILGGIRATNITSIVWRRRRPYNEILSAAAAKREKRIGGNKRQSPPLGQPGKIWIGLFIHFVLIADNFTSFFVFGSLSCPFHLHECVRSVKKAWVETFLIHILYMEELWSVVVVFISIQGPFDGVSVRGQLFCPKHSHLPFPLPKVVKNLTVPEWDTNANSFVNYTSLPKGLRLFSA